MFTISIIKPPTLRDQEKYSKPFKDFLEMCLKKDPEERISATDGLNCSFLVDANGIAALKNRISRAAAAIATYGREETVLKTENDIDPNDNLSETELNEYLKQQEEVKNYIKETRAKRLEEKKKRELQSLKDKDHDVIPASNITSISPQENRNAHPLQSLGSGRKPPTKKPLLRTSSSTSSNQSQNQNQNVPVSVDSCNQHCDSQISNRQINGKNELINSPTQQQQQQQQQQQPYGNQQTKMQQTTVRPPCPPTNVPRKIRQPPPNLPQRNKEGLQANSGQSLPKVQQSNTNISPDKPSPQQDSVLSKSPQLEISSSSDQVSVASSDFGEASDNRVSLSNITKFPVMSEKSLLRFDLTSDIQDNRDALARLKRLAETDPRTVDFENWKADMKREIQRFEAERNSLVLRVARAEESSDILEERMRKMQEDYFIRTVCSILWCLTSLSSSFLSCIHFSVRVNYVG